jgi:hypothetical protein
MNHLLLAMIGSHKCSHTRDDETHLENIHPEDCTRNSRIVLQHWPPCHSRNEEDDLLGRKIVAEVVNDQESELASLLISMPSDSQ